MAASERLRTLQSASTSGKPSEAIQLAVDYELVTEHTNFLLVHARAAGEKATSICPLHKVAQMVPAGWSGNPGSQRLRVVSRTSECR